MKGAITLSIAVTALGFCIYLVCWQAAKTPDFTIERTIG